MTKKGGNKDASPYSPQMSTPASTSVVDGIGNPHRVTESN